MGLHDDYLADAADALAEVHATEAALIVRIDPDDEETIEVDGWLGEISIDQQELGGGQFTQRRQARKCAAQARAVDRTGATWSPTTASVVEAAGTTWNVERIVGLGRPIVTLHLVRVEVINKQGAGRETGRR